MEQGKIAALNVFEAEVENYKVPFSFYNILGKDLFRLGVTRGTESSCTGNIENLDFICYYHLGNQLTGVISAGELNNKKTLLLREALDHNLPIQVKPLLNNEK